MHSICIPARSTRDQKWALADLGLSIVCLCEHVYLECPDLFSIRNVILLDDADDAVAIINKGSSPRTGFAAVVQNIRTARMFDPTAGQVVGVIQEAGQPGCVSGKHPPGIIIIKNRGVDPIMPLEESRHVYPIVREVLSFIETDLVHIVGLRDHVILPVVTEYIGIGKVEILRQDDPVVGPIIAI